MPSRVDGQKICFVCKRSTDVPGYSCGRKDCYPYGPLAPEISRFFLWGPAIACVLVIIALLTVAYFGGFGR